MQLSGAHDEADRTETLLLSVEAGASGERGWTLARDDPLALPGVALMSAFVLRRSSALPMAGADAGAAPRWTSMTRPVLVAQGASSSRPRPRRPSLAQPPPGRLRHTSPNGGEISTGEGESIQAAPADRAVRVEGVGCLSTIK